MGVALNRFASFSLFVVVAICFSACLTPQRAPEPVDLSPTDRGEIIAEKPDLKFCFLNRFEDRRLSTIKTVAAAQEVLLSRLWPIARRGQGKILNVELKVCSENEYPRCQFLWHGRQEELRYTARCQNSTKDKAKSTHRILSMRREVGAPMDQRFISDVALSMFEALGQLEPLEQQ